MKERLFSLFLVLFCVWSMDAKADGSGSFSIKGQVVDSLTNETVPYATLRIALAATPQNAVKLLACDADGKFETSLTAAGKYLLSLQSIGKAPAEKQFTLSDKNRNLNLGKLYMHEDNQRLGEVTVTAQKPLVKVEIDKLSYNLEDDPEAKTSNTLDMLRKVPMVTVDGDDKIQLKGSTNFKIYMNGKPSNLLSNNPSDVLKSMPANSVKNIEVITDPGAKYDAEGIGGIINIITTKNALQGYTGTVRGSASTLGRYRGSGYVSAKIGKVGLTANYTYNYENSPWNDSHSLREEFNETREHSLSQVGRSKRRGPFQFGYMEGSYEIDSLNLLTLGVNLFQGKMKNRSEYAVSMQDIDGNSVYGYDRLSRAESTFGSTDVSLDYQHSTHKKDELLTLSYRFSRNPDNSDDYTDIFNIHNYMATHRYPESNINDASTSEHTGQVDYTTPTWKDQTFEAGVKYIFRQSRSETERSVFNDSINRWEDITANDASFRHTQHIYAAYLGYVIKLNKFGIKAGLRAEGTALNVKYALAKDKNFDTHYFDLVPNGTLSYQINMTQQIRLGYNMRIQRPGIWYLNPYVNNVDPQNISYGNPNLDSEKSNNINFNYSMFAQKFSINASASYTFVNNSIEQYTFIDPDMPGVSQATYGNIGKKQQTGFFLYGNWNAAAFFSVYMNAGLDYTDLRSDKNEMKNSGFSGRLFMGTRFNLPMDFRIDVNGGYFSPWVQLQGKGSAFHFIGFRLNKDFMKKKLTVTLGCESPFWKTMKMEQTTTGQNFRMVNTNYRSMRDFRISVSYRFGTLKEAIKKVRRGISNDDVKGNAGGGAEGGEVG